MWVTERQLWIEDHKPNVSFEKSGYVFLSMLVGDLLPYDYKITESLNEQDKEH